MNAEECTDRSDSSEPDRRSSRQREQIICVAAELFGQKGFHGTGVRQVAGAAGVNVAMVNYYFGSKEGVLREIFERFFAAIKDAFIDHAEDLDALGQRTNGPIEGDSSKEEAIDGVSVEALRARLSLGIRLIVPVIREHRDFFQVVIRELAVDHPGLSQMRAQYIKELFPFLYGSMFPRHLFQKIERGEMLRLGPRSVRLDIAGPFFTAMLLSHFLLRSTVPFVTGLAYDDAFLEEYIAALPDFFLFGIFGSEPTR